MAGLAMVTLGGVKRCVLWHLGIRVLLAVKHYMAETEQNMQPISAK